MVALHLDFQSAGVHVNPDLCSLDCPVNSDIHRKFYTWLGTREQRIDERAGRIYGSIGTLRL